MEGRMAVLHTRTSGELRRIPSWCGSASRRSPSRRRRLPERRPETNPLEHRCGSTRSKVPVRVALTGVVGLSGPEVGLGDARTRSLVAAATVRAGPRRSRDGPERSRGRPERRLVAAAQRRPEQDPLEHPCGSIRDHCSSEGRSPGAPRRRGASQEADSPWVERRALMARSLEHRCGSTRSGPPVRAARLRPEPG